MKIIHTCYFSVVRYVKGTFLPFSKSRLPIYHNFIPYSGFNGHHPALSVYFFVHHPKEEHVRILPEVEYLVIFPRNFAQIQLRSREAFRFMTLRITLFLLNVRPRV